MKIPQGVVRRKNCWGGWEYLLCCRNNKRREIEYVALFLNDLDVSYDNGWYVVGRNINYSDRAKSLAMDRYGPYKDLQECFSLFVDKKNLTFIEN